MRTPTFQTRYLDLGANLADSIRAAFLGTGPRKRDLAERIEAFAARVSLLTQDERLVLWEDLMQIQTGDIRHILADESAGASQSGTSLPNVRLANGETDRQVRMRLMRTFNSPFFPEVLIASSVFSEGVDLHLDCRHVIHHDLDWNPSVLEQRTGRVDRVGSLAERTGEPIVVFEPFLAGTQDERLFPRGEGSRGLVQCRDGGQGAFDSVGAGSTRRTCAPTCRSCGYVELSAGRIDTFWTGPDQLFVGSMAYPSNTQSSGTGPRATRRS